MAPASRQRSNAAGRVEGGQDVLGHPDGDQVVSAVLDAGPVGAQEH